jgi:16S rRNA (guanine527-N7)-methyltransferase
MSDEVFRELLKQRADASNVSIDLFLEEKLAAYFRLLAHWNSRINLTSLPLEPATPQAVDRLFIEPLVAASFVTPSVSVWFDLGSGGGSPAVPLQLVKSAQRLIMVESRERKAAFLRQVIRELPLTGAEVEVSRIESVAAEPHNSGAADLVTVRAVRMEASLVGWIQALLRFGGKAILFGADASVLSLPRGLELTNVVETAGRGLLVLQRAGL